MEQYIRDKYERKTFMSNEARASLHTSQGAIGMNKRDNPANYGAALPSSSSSIWATGGESHPLSQNQRYPIQMQSLQEMGFTNTKANAEALGASQGNLQAAIESLLVHKTGALSLNQHRSSSSRASDDLVDIFGAPPPRDNHVSSTQASVSILDADLPIPAPEHPAESSEEFDEFEAAPASPPTSFTADEPLSVHRSSLDATHSPFDTSPSSSTTAHHNHHHHHHHQPPTKNLPSVLSNPWASNNTDAGSNVAGAFDDIDPFRGFTPSNRSN